VAIRSFASALAEAGRNAMLGLESVSDDAGFTTAKICVDTLAFKNLIKHLSGLCDGVFRKERLDIDRKSVV
jgi:hypothetical protein